MFKTKKVAAVFLAAIVLCFSLFLCGCETKDKIPSPTKEKYVNDFANVINEDDKNDMLNRGKDLEDKTGAQIALVTIESLKGEDITSYATKIGNQWGVGSEEKDDGILILFSLKDREFFTAIGKGLEGALPDSKVGRLEDTYALPDLKNDNFSKGLKLFYAALINEVFLENGIELEEDYIPIDQVSQVKDEGSLGSGTVVYWIILIVAVVVYAVVFKGRGIFFLGGPFGGFRGGGSGGSFGGGGFSGGSFGGGSFGGGGAGRKF